MYSTCIYIYLVFIAQRVVVHDRQDHIFPDFSLTTFKFPNLSMLSSLVATLY